MTVEGQTWAMAEESVPDGSKKVMSWIMSAHASEKLEVRAHLLFGGAALESLALGGVSKKEAPKRWTRQRVGVGCAALWRGVWVAYGVQF